MKILIACDGSEEGNAALRGLRRAGLPESGEALILTVAGTLAQLSGIPYAALATGPWCYLQGSSAERHLAEEDMEHARKIVEQGALQLRSDFPEWSISTDFHGGSAKTIVLEESQNWKPDLIVIGAPVRSAFSHFLKASVSKAIWQHAKCSVRIGRSLPSQNNRPIRLLVGVNGSENALMAVKAAAARNWPPGTLAKVIGTIELDANAGLSFIGRAAVAEYLKQKNILSLVVRNAAARLQASGVAAVPEVRFGAPSRVLIKEAKEWGADTVFVGASAADALEHLFNGKISSHAPCSVELCRPIYLRSGTFGRSCESEADRRRAMVG
jgi:nucleotide-binding universal stress UspA family protein